MQPNAPPQTHHYPDFTQLRATTVIRTPLCCFSKRRLRAQQPLQQRRTPRSRCCSPAARFPSALPSRRSVATSSTSTSTTATSLIPAAAPARRHSAGTAQHSSSTRLSTSVQQQRSRASAAVDQSNMAAGKHQMPRVALYGGPPPYPSISAAQMQEVLEVLAGHRQRLASDAAFLTSQTDLIGWVIDHLKQLMLGPRAALEAALPPKVLQSLARVMSAALQHMPALLGRDAAAALLAARVCSNFSGVILSLARTANFTAPTLDDAAALKTLQDAGVIKAYTAAARAATKYLTAQLQQGAHIQAPPINAETRCPTALSDKQTFAAACNCVLGLWKCISALECSLDLMQPSSPLASTITTTAGLAMALARSYAHAGVYGCTVWHDVLEVALALARAAVQAPGHNSTPNTAILGDDSVLQLLLLALAAGAEQLHDDYGGISQQRLLPSLRTVAADGRVGSGRVAVPPHHKELLDALLGVRSLRDDFLPATADRLLNDMSLVPLACGEALTTRMQHASLTGDTVQQLRGALGTHVLPVQLAWVEVLALAPPYFADSAGLPNLGPLLFIAVKLQLLCGAAQQLPGDAVVQELSPICRDTLWLVLAPVLLSMCRRHGGATDDDEAPRHGPSLSGPSPFRDSAPHVFAMCTHILLLACADIRKLASPACRAEVGPRVRTEQAVAMVTEFDFMISYFLDQPLQASLLTEAVLLTGPLDLVSDLVPPARHKILRELAKAASGLAAEAAARAYAAAPAAGTAAAQHQRRVVQQLFQQMVAGLKHSIAPAPAAQGAALIIPEPTYKTSTEVCTGVLRSALRVLGDASAAGVEPQPSNAQARAVAARMPPDAQLLWLHLLGRGFAAAGAPTGGSMLTELPGAAALATRAVQQLSEEPPARISASNSHVIAFGYFGATMFNSSRWLAIALAKARSMLQPGGPALDAVEAGSAAAAVTAADLARLRRQAGDVQALLEPLLVAVLPGSSFSADGCSVVVGTKHEQDMLKLAAMFQSFDLAGLLQGLAAFGSALVGAFPAPGSVCGNGACASFAASLERFNGGATSACSACKSVKFCSRQCAKAAWKQSHKGPCAVLQQRAKAVVMPAAAAAAAAEAPAGTSAAAAAPEDSAPQDAAAK